MGSTPNMVAFLVKVKWRSLLERPVFFRMLWLGPLKILHHIIYPAPSGNLWHGWLKNPQLEIWEDDLAHNHPQKWTVFLCQVELPGCLFFISHPFPSHLGRWSKVIKPSKKTHMFKGFFGGSKSSFHGFPLPKSKLQRWSIDDDFHHFPPHFHGAN
jgi:hypothetical protein